MVLGHIITHYCSYSRFGICISACIPQAAGKRGGESDLTICHRQTRMKHVCVRGSELLVFPPFQDIVLTLKDKLSIRAIEYFALVLEQQYSITKLLLLHEDELIQKVRATMDAHIHTCSKHT